MRFLKNPFFVSDLKPLSGKDAQVRKFVLADSDALSFIEHVEELLKFLLPLYQRERRSYLTIAIGCTGGRHRSVVIAGHLSERMAALGFQVGLKHRDIDKA